MWRHLPPHAVVPRATCALASRGVDESCLLYVVRACTLRPPAQPLGGSPDEPPLSARPSARRPLDGRLPPAAGTEPRLLAVQVMTRHPLAWMAATKRSPYGLACAESAFWASAPCVLSYSASATLTLDTLAGSDMEGRPGDEEHEWGRFNNMSAAWAQTAAGYAAELPGQRTMFVRYEDLTLEPEPLVAAIGARLGVALPAEVLTAEKSSKDHGKGRVGRVRAALRIRSVGYTKSFSGMSLATERELLQGLQASGQLRRHDYLLPPAPPPGELQEQLARRRPGSAVARRGRRRGGVVAVATPSGARGREPWGDGEARGLLGLRELLPAAADDPSSVGLPPQLQSWEGGGQGLRGRPSTPRVPNWPPLAELVGGCKPPLWRGAGNKVRVKREQADSGVGGGGRDGPHKSTVIVV